MNENILTSRVTTGILNARRIFWIVAAFEVATMMAIFYGDLIFLAYYFGIIFTPILLLFIPIEPTVGIVLMLLATSLDFLGIISRAEGVEFHITYFQIVLLVTLASTLLHAVLRRKMLFHSVNLWAPSLAFYFVLAVSLTYTPNFLDGVIYYAGMVFLLIVTFLVIYNVDEHWKVRLVTWSLVIVPTAISLLTIYQLLTQGLFYSPVVQRMAVLLGLPVYRASGTFHNPNTLACFVMVSIVLTFGLLFTRRQSLISRLLYITFFIVSCGGILGTFSRGGWVSTIAAIICVVALHKKWSYFAYFAGFIVLVTIFLTIQIPQLWEVIFDRFVSIVDPTSDDSSSARIALIRSAIWMWQDHPLFGVGLRGFPLMYDNYADPNMPYYMIDLQEAHTIQALFLAEYGIIGVVVGTWLFITILFHGIKTSLAMKNEYLRNVQIALTALFVGFIVNFTFAVDMSNNVFFICLGMMYAIPLVEKYGTTNLPAV